MPARYAGRRAPAGLCPAGRARRCLKTETARPARKNGPLPTFIAFLRAVNVGKREYPMAELREALTAAGFEEVETHIQTGNVLVRTSMRSRAKVVAALEKAMLEDRGFEVPVVLMTPAELTEVYDEAARLRQGPRAQGALPEPARRRRPTPRGRRLSRRGPSRGRRSGSGGERCT